MCSKKNDFLKARMISLVIVNERAIVKNKLVMIILKYISDIAITAIQHWHFLDECPDPVPDRTRGLSWQWWQPINIWRIQMITFGTLWMVRLKINNRLCNNVIEKLRGWLVCKIICYLVCLDFLKSLLMT